MNIKKLLILTAAGLASSAALAGSYYAPRPPAPPAPMVSDTGFYIEALAGYNRYTFSDGYGSPIFGDGQPGILSEGWTSRGTGNWAFAADIGYQFYRYFSLELGGIYTLRAKYQVEVQPGSSDYKFIPWYLYFAGKLSLPVYDNLSVFTKLGVGYQKTKVDDLSAYGWNRSTSNWGAMFGAGLAYNFTQAFYITGEWLRFTGKISNGVTQTTAPNIFLLGLGYKFIM